MLVITSHRELVDTLNARLLTLTNAQRAGAPPRTRAERDRLQGAIGELSLIRDVLNNAAINITNPDVPRSIIHPGYTRLAATQLER